MEYVLYLLALLAILLLVWLMRPNFARRMRRDEKMLLERCLCDRALPLFDKFSAILWYLDCLSFVDGKDLAKKLGKAQWKRLNATIGDLIWELDQLDKYPRTGANQQRLDNMLKFLESVCVQIFGVGGSAEKLLEVIRRYKRLWDNGPVGYHMGHEPINNHSIILAGTSMLSSVLPVRHSLRCMSKSVKLVRVFDQLYRVVKCYEFSSPSGALISREYELYCLSTGRFRYLGVSASSECKEVYFSISSVAPSVVGLGEFTNLPQRLVFGETILFPLVDDREPAPSVPLYTLSSSGEFIFGSQVSGFEAVDVACWDYGKYRLSAVWIDQRTVVTHEECISVPPSNQPQPIVIVA